MKGGNVMAMMLSEGDDALLKAARAGGSLQFAVVVMEDDEVPGDEHFAHRSVILGIVPTRQIAELYAMVMEAWMPQETGTIRLIPLSVSENGARAVIEQDKIRMQKAVADLMERIKK